MMRVFRYILPTFIAYAFTAILYQNFIFFTSSLGSNWINAKFYWVLFLGLLLSGINLVLEFRAIKIVYGFILFLIVCLIIIWAFNSLEILKHNSMLCFFAIFSGITLILNCKKVKFLN